jgi:hypothetical protein
LPVGEDQEKLRLQSWKNLMITCGLIYKIHIDPALGHGSCRLLHVTWPALAKSEQTVVKNHAVVKNMTKGQQSRTLFQARKVS